MKLTGIAALLAGAAMGLALSSATFAAESIKIGLILPMTGPSASTGRQIDAAVKLYMAQHGNKVAGQTIEVILRDDTGTPDVTKRLAQELVVNDHVAVIAGFGLTPLALAAAPIATQGKVPEVVMAAGTQIIPERSPFIVRSSFTLPQATLPMADWAAQNGIKKVATLVSDFGPGNDAAKTFKERFTALGGTIVAELKSPLLGPDFSPYLQSIKDSAPDAVFLFVPSGQGASLMKQVAERGFKEAGIRVIATGDVTDDDQLNDMGDAVLGIITSHHYSAAHPSAANKAFVEAFRKANNNMRPNFMAVGGYDGMELIYKAIEKVGSAEDGTKLVEAMKGMAFESVRGPISIGADSRDITQNIYIRRVEKLDGQLYNVEFSTVEAVPPK